MTTEQTGYAEYTIDVDGALEQVIHVDTEGHIFEVSYGRDVPDHLTDFEAFIADLENFAEGNATPVEVYHLWHEHATDMDCECAQYATDHRPAYSFGSDDE